MPEMSRSRWRIMWSLNRLLTMVLWGSWFVFTSNIFFLWFIIFVRCLNTQLIRGTSNRIHTTLYLHLFYWFHTLTWPITVNWWVTYFTLCQCLKFFITLANTICRIGTSCSTLLARTIKLYTFWWQLFLWRFDFPILGWTESLLGIFLTTVPMRSWLRPLWLIWISRTIISWCFILLFLNLYQLSIKFFNVVF